MWITSDFENVRKIMYWMGMKHDHHVAFVSLVGIVTSLVGFYISP